MFTGLVDDVGTIERVAETRDGRELRIRCRYDDLRDGESVAVNGACLTVLEQGSGWFSVAAIVTTLGRTTIGDWRPDDRVNLERALRAGDRLGGHIVQGHVDGVATVVVTEEREDALLAELEMPADLVPLLVPHGSIAVDGVSLTVNALPADNVLQISLIDYTRRHTTLGALRAGQRVHVEGDVIGKFVQRFVAPYAEARA
jgi:riboflavin synthase